MKKAVLISALVSMWISLTLWFTGNEMVALYVGMWCPTILSLEPFLPRKKKQKKNKAGRPHGWRKHPNKKHAIKVLRSRGLTYRQIADQVGVPKSTVHNYVYDK
tara:strand:+ start:1788 stop:2099 length:312 start_codon:yes stop_codon:yes gene_type:complete